MNPMLGPNEMHWAGIQYREFHSPFGVNGLAKEENGGKTLSLLAVDVHPWDRRQGRFRSFITEAKKQYTEIFVWEIWNPDLESALNRYGFSHTTKITEEDEQLTGMVWKQTTTK